MEIISKEIEEYALQNSSPVDAFFEKLEADTHKFMEFPQMLTGKLEGRFLKFLVQLTGAKSVLEVGMFTGYSALWMSSGMPDDGEIVTCELEPKHIAFAQKYFNETPLGKKIKVMPGPALATLKNLKGPFDFVFIDADKPNYDNYYEAALTLINSGGWIALDNMLWSGKVLDSDQDEETTAIHLLNEKLKQDPRVETLLITIRDGVQLVRKK